MFDRSAGCPAQFMAVVEQEVMDQWLPRASQICMIELVAVIVAIETFRHYLAGKHVLIFVDSEAVEGALVKGYTARPDICELVGVFWQLALQLKCSVYIDRVPTDANPADHPSRNRMEIGEKLGWKTVEFELPDELKHPDDV